MKRNFGIDLLRGISILFVIIHHLALPFRLPLKTGPIGEILPAFIINGISFNGYESVFIFFVISGFLITSRCLNKYGSLQNIKIKEFYFQRSKRIFPL